MAMERDNKAPRGRKRRKVCAFCVDKVEQIDYKDAAKLRRFTSERAKILPRRTTGTCAMHQACPSDRPAALCDRLIRNTNLKSLSFLGKNRLFLFHLCQDKRQKRPVSYKRDRAFCLGTCGPYSTPISL